MDFLDIRAYPRKLFRKYWRKVTSDPHFSQPMDALSKQHSWVRLAKLTTWKQYRKVLYNLVSYLINKTTDGLSWSGVENIPVRSVGLHKPHGAIFISSHRSTSLDPILFNYMCFVEHGETAYNAVGDNLLKTPWLGHLLRLNGGFIVKRQIEDVDKKMAEAEKLSLYIRKLLQQGKHVWIAQGNGRTKDGNDKTDSAVLAMLKLAHREKSWKTFSAHIPIIPVSISYEEVPLDTTIVKDHLGELDKSDSTLDSTQIINEINQKKRRIHIHVSERVEAAKRSEIVNQVDEKIIQGMRIWESNTGAYELLKGSTSENSGIAQWFKEKLASQNPRIREALLRFYAAPIINRAKLVKR